MKKWKIILDSCDKCFQIGMVKGDAGNLNEKIFLDATGRLNQVYFIQPCSVISQLIFTPVSLYIQSLKFFLFICVSG